jgi:hypothetical protein
MLIGSWKQLVCLGQVLDAFLFQFLLLIEVIVALFVRLVEQV